MSRPYPSSLSPQILPLHPQFFLRPDAGGAEAEPPGLLPADLTTLTDKELSRLEETIRSGYTKERSKAGPTNIAKIREHVEAVKAVRAEAERRSAEAAEIETEVADLDTIVNPPDAPAAEGTEGAPTAEAPAAVAESVAASGRITTRERPAAPRADQMRVRPGTEPVLDRRRPSIIAAGDVPGFSAGSEMEEKELGYAFARKAESLLAGAGKGSASGSVFSMKVEYPEDRYLDGRDSSSVVEDKVQAVIAAGNRQRGLSVNGPNSLVAAGGLCAAVAVYYDMMTIATADRPVRDALARFGADRGGVRLILPPHLSDTSPGVNVWTEATDAAWAPGLPTKAFATITCGTEEVTLVDAIVLSLVNGNFNARFFPEQWTAWYTVALAQWARVADSHLLDGIRALSTQVTAPKVLGAARDALVHLGTAADYYRNHNRMDDDAIVQVLAPAWLKGEMRGDFTRQQPGDNAVALKDSEIEGYFAANNIEPVWYKDSATTGTSQLFTQQGNGVLEGYPSVAQTYCFAPGTFLHLDGGTLDLGIEIRDFSLDQTNRVAAFMESFEQVAFKGVESLSIDLTLCSNGETSAPVTVPACLGS